MRRFLQVTLIAFAIGMIGFALTRAPDAQASVAYKSPYTYEQTFGSGLRLLRVDMGFKILERDRDLGYIVFEYTSPESGKKIYNGSMEIVDAKDGVHVSVQIPEMPQYHEKMIIDQLAKKLVSEHGEPPARSKDKKKEKDGDKGDDDDEDGKDKDKPKDGDKGDKDGKGG
ncbi:MAG: hypothetical protein HOW73_02980 [Polyangiaceae bacterium]|nr:hypothetical protein [Polyangiaceae bacterium]